MDSENIKEWQETLITQAGLSEEEARLARVYYDYLNDSRHLDEDETASLGEQRMKLMQINMSDEDQELLRKALEKIRQYSENTSKEMRPRLQ